MRTASALGFLLLAVGLLANTSRADTAFVHRVPRAGTNSTILDHPSTMAHPEALVFVTAVRGDAPPAGPFGVWYGSGHWSIITENFLGLPAGATFNVLVVPSDRAVISGGATAFRWFAVASNIVGESTYLDAARLNGNPDAHLLVTQVLHARNPAAPGDSPSNPNEVGLWYDAARARWAIVNESRAPMPVGAAFNVLVAPSARSLASDGASVLVRGDAGAIVFSTLSTRIRTPEGHLYWPATPAVSARSGGGWQVTGLDGAPPPRGSTFTVLSISQASASVPAAALFGFAELHSHPASFLGNGGSTNGRSGIMWGVPQVGDYQSKSFAERFGQCSDDTHFPNSDPDPIRHLIRGMIVAESDAQTKYPHSPFGAPKYQNWPSALSLDHQQIDVAWLHNAWAGGLRLWVASAMDNEAISKVYNWDTDKTYQAARAFLVGQNLRPQLGMPERFFSYDRARQQIEFIKEMRDENRAWMEIARNAAEARAIISSGRLAVVLGVEMDTLTFDEMQRLVNEADVRLITPIHFVNNQIGGAAAYEMMFSALSGLLGTEPDGTAGSPYDTGDDANLYFRIDQPFGPDVDGSLGRLLQSTMGWARPLGVACPNESQVSEGYAARRGCPGQRNREGLTTVGRSAIESLIQSGVIIDLAHMSQQSQQDALDIAERLHCPVINSHTGFRPDQYLAAVAEGDQHYSERDMRATEAARLFALGGVVGLGTTPGGRRGEFESPFRVYYNAGDPIIMLNPTRTTWVLDLRQPETQHDPVAGRFEHYRVTVRIGNDDLGSGNGLRLSLLGDADSPALAVCELDPLHHGITSHTVASVECSMRAALNVGDVRGVGLDHDARDDNVDIDELRVEAQMPDSRGWLTLIQRTGGPEGEVVRLKQSHDSAFALPDFGPSFWVTRMLPHIASSTGIDAFRVRTYTNEDDLADSRPAAFEADFSQHREPLRSTFAPRGLPVGTTTDDRFALQVLGEPIGGIVGLKLGAGLGSNDLSTEIDGVEAWRTRARESHLSPGDVDAFLEGAAPLVIGNGITALSSAPIWFPVVEVLEQQHDNWSALVSVRAVSGDREIPLLVNYNPTQRLKKDQPDSELFRGLPDGVEASRLYGGIVVNYRTVRDFDDGTYIHLTVRFSDGTHVNRLLAPTARISTGREYRGFIGFDRRRRGSELVNFEIGLDSTGRRSNELWLRSLDIGLITDPVESWVDKYTKAKALAGRAAYPGQIAIGTDLSGYAPQIPFTAAPISYPFNVDEIAGRPDPGRRLMGAALADPRRPAGNIDGTAATTRMINNDGIATIGQLPDFVAAATAIDRVRRDGGWVGPEVYASADAFVRAWERLNTIGDPPRGRVARQCSDLTAMTSMSTTTVPTAPASPRSDVTPAPTSRTDAAPAPDSGPRAVPSSRTSAGEVPDVTHTTFKDAAATLERSGYYVGVIEKRFEPSLPHETVIEQTPPAGTALPPGSKISIVVAVNGAPPSRKNVEPAQEKPPAAQLAKIPAVVRSSEKQAIATLEKLGFLPGRIEHRFYPNLPPGTVMGQHPAAGTMAVPGASVDLVIASSTKSQ